MATSVDIKHDESVAAPGDPKEYKLVTLFLNEVGAGATWDSNFILAQRGAGALSTDVYQHVCTVGDLNKYATEIGRATVIAGEYYRIDTFDTFYDSLEDLAELKVIQLQKTQYLVDDWDSYSADFPGTDTTTVTST